MRRPERPVIGVAWPKRDYLKSVEHAGGMPRILRAEFDPLPAALEECDGLLLTGGADVDPVLYGDTDRHSSVEIDAARDAYEFALARHALDHELPMLAICRGVQLLNVAAGGTLVQDIPSAMDTTLTHRRPRPPRARNTNAHDITIAPGTRLAQMLPPGSDVDAHLAVNSRHHQAVKQLAPGFVVSAAAPDGVVEAIERAAGGFCVGVQWHPENYWRTGEFSGLFRGLVEAASERALRRAAHSHGATDFHRGA